MGILGDIFLQLATGVTKAAIAGGGMIAKISAAIAAEAKPRISAAIRAIRQSWKDRRAQRKPAESESDISDELVETNRRLSELNNKRLQGKLSQREWSEVENLKHRRSELLSSIQDADEFRVAEKITDHGVDYDSVTISDRTTHLIQSVVGQTIYNKQCPQCGWKMQLQWKRGQQYIGVQGISWGCTGYYWGKCNHWEALSADDLNLFARVNRPEYNELSPRQFSDSILGHQQLVTARMDDLLRNTEGETRAYRCPIHGEPMVLRQKVKHNGQLLDMYFLGCPRWKRDNTGCRYLVKLKSPAQLHAYLEARTGSGII